MNMLRKAFGLVSEERRREEVISGPCLLDDIISSDDILFQVLLRLSEVRTLASCCPLVCKRWYSLTADPKFWLEKCIYNGATLPPVHLRKQFTFDYKLILLKTPYDRNLIRNPSGEEGYNGWKLLERGGDGWVVERPPKYCEQDVFPIAFATSYHWCVKEQKIDLIAAGVEATVLDEVKPMIIVSEWTAAREDCASKYRLKASLNAVDANGACSVADTREVTVQKQQWEDGKWQKVEVVFEDYPEGTREVILQSAGKDSQFWAGHYGSKMANASVTVVFK